MRAAHVVCAVLLPPLAVASVLGLGRVFWFNVVLTIVGLWVLGVLHALLIVTVAHRLYDTGEERFAPTSFTLTSERFRRRASHRVPGVRLDSRMTPDWHDTPAQNGRKPAG